MKILRMNNIRWSLVLSDHNMFLNCKFFTPFILLILLDVFVSVTAIELCGGIRNRFVCDDQDPAVFHICLGNNQYSMVCPGTLHFNSRTQNCDWPNSVNCVQEARSRQMVNNLVQEATLSPVTPKRKLPVTTQRNFPPSKTRSFYISTSSPKQQFSTLNTTKINLIGSAVPLLETSSSEAPHSRYRLKIVPGMDNPGEALLPADEKVIEEVKKLSEELKHIDNYLQSLEPDQVDFMIEPYKAAEPQVKQSYASRFLNATSRKEVNTSSNPYKKRWSSTTSRETRITSPNPYAAKSPNPYAAKSPNPYTANSPNPYTANSPNDNYGEPEVQVEFKKIYGKLSTSPRTRSPFRPSVRLYHGDHIPAVYRLHDVSSSVGKTSKTFPKTELEINLLKKKESFSKNSNQENRIHKMHYENKSQSQERQSQFATSSKPEMSFRTQTLTSRISDQINSKLPSVAKFVSPRSSRPSWTRIPNKSQTSDKKHSVFQYKPTKSSSISQQPSKYRAVVTPVAKSTSQGSQGGDAQRNKESKFTPRVLDSSSLWWSTARSSSSSASSTSQKLTKSSATTPARKSTLGTQKSYTTITRKGAVSPSISSSKATPQWWLSTKKEQKSTEAPDISKRFTKKRSKPGQFVPNPNYNTNTPNLDFGLAASNEKSRSYQQQNLGWNGASINAPAALERNFALHNSQREQERSFRLHQVNAPASLDRFTLHRPYNNERSSSDIAAQTDSVFALHKPDTAKKEEKISTYKSPIEKYETKKGKCSSTWCKLPDCRCIGSDIPGDLNVKDVPQMVMLTFDDSINGQNIHYYRGLYNGTLKNPNGCPIKSTFFVSGDSTDYQMVKMIYKQGHEIGSHTLTHRDPTNWWAYAGYENWEREIVGMRDRLHEKSGVPIKEINGMRAPFLQVGGDAQYAMLKENKFRYDSSMVTGNLYSNKQPPIWPFTLDTPPESTTCSLTPCPTRSYPGLWEVPLIRWYGSNKMACAMPDACTLDLGSKGTVKFMEENFKRHYTTNRAPFGIFIHASWFGRKDGNFQGLFEFLASLADKKDVWVVTLNQALDWVQHPVRLSTLSSLKSWQC